MEQKGFVDGFLAALQGGDPAMLIIGFNLLLAMAFVFERIVRLYFTYSIDGVSFMFEVQRYVLANDIEGALRLCNGAPNAALPKVLKAGLQRASRTEEQVQNAIDAASLDVIPKLERRLPYIALIANVATLFGLLGTITGLIRAFAAIAVADPAQRQAILGRGISEAMNATAFGLITAIFSMIAHAILSSKASSITEQVDEFGVKLIDLLSARKIKHSNE